jgi:hypothetical protein
MTISARYSNVFPKSRTESPATGAAPFRVPQERRKVFSSYGNNSSRETVPLATIEFLPRQEHILIPPPYRYSFSRDGTVPPVSFSGDRTVPQITLQLLESQGQCLLLQYHTVSPETGATPRFLQRHCTCICTTYIFRKRHLLVCS